MKKTNPASEHDARGAGTTATVTDLDAVRRSRRAESSDVGSETSAAAGEVRGDKVGGTRAGVTSVGDEKAGDEKRRRRMPNRRFDTEKVERLKAEIAEGRYEIDHERVAAKFIEYDPS